MSVARERGYLPRALAVLGAGMAVRVAYVLLQPRFDPTFARPILDGAYYVELARAIGAGTAPSGPYYMPPLYPTLLAGFLRVCGDSWALLYLLQQAVVVAGAGLLGWAARRSAGDGAGLAASALALAYHPSMYFASRPLGEALALLLLSAGVLLAGEAGRRAGGGAGLAVGLASLIRPNLLPLPAVWAAIAARRGDWLRGALLAGAAILTILPTACRNHAASGRWIPVSANGGVVFWLGNAPGAVGVYTPVPGLTGALATQQAEAIAEASARTGRPLGPAEADAFWWREGIRARAREPLGSVALLARRAALTVDNAEHGLDYAPAFDPHPLRWLAPLPFACVLGLAVFGLSARGAAKSGGASVWSAIGIAALAPLVFYVSSRHRLPVAWLLAVPAGAGLAALGTVKRPAPYVAGVVALVVSLAVPSRGLARSEEAAAWASVADVERRAGRLDEAQAAARRATEVDTGSAVAWFNRGVIAGLLGHREESEQAYRSALAADPAQPDAAANLAGLLVASGRAGEAPPLLERALAVWPRHSVGWTNLVVAYAAAGDRERAGDAARRAESHGVVLDRELVESVGRNP